ncbi:MAG: YicC family protein [Candidatus Marinimicrobia bacterium]|nr:YicC family protein [Candidatus Neomarinimicrobiota bacterium]
MIQSMTGYGQSFSGSGTKKITASIKAVNGRYLDVKIRGIDIEPAVEKKIRDIITEKLIRGTILVNLDKDNGNKTQDLTFNSERYELIEAVLLEIQKKYGRHLDMGDLINANDLFTYVDNDPITSENLIKAVSKACSEVLDMRSIEGIRLKKDFEDRLLILINLLSDLESDLPKELEKREEKYKNKISDLLNNATIDEVRITQEIAILAEKSDVTEEVVRLKSHFDQFKSMLNKKEPSGKGLNFLLQEISREINTIGSKCTSEKIINKIINMKDETEKVREQVQNIL